MAIDSRALIASGVEVGQAVFMEEDQPVDLEFFGRRYLQSGFIEDDTALFDTNIFTSKAEVTPANSHTVGWGSGGAQSIAYGAGLYVQGGTSGQIFTSPDLTNWTSRVSQFGLDTISGIVYSGGQFVAVGGGGKISTSADGITWEARTSGTVSAITKVTHNADNLYVAVSSSNALTSADGITWSINATGSASALQDVSYSPLVGLFAAGGINGVLFTSPDGITWTSRTSQFGATSDIHAMGYGGGFLIAVGEAGKTSVSYNGIDWTLGGTGIAQRNYSVEYSGSFFIGGEAQEVYKSGDGLVWESIQAAPIGNISSLIVSITSSDDALVIAQGSGGDVSSYSRISYAGSTVAHAENGENQYVRIS